MTELRLSSFSTPVTFLVAQDRRFFEDAGLDVTHQHAASSDQQFRALDAGEVDLVQTAFDNVVNYRLNTGNAIGRRCDVVAVLPLDFGMNLTLVAAPSIPSIDLLRGKRVAVDAPTSGFAFVLYALLENGGLARTDYELQSVGGARMRLDSLVQGNIDATLLSGGLEIIAGNRGLRSLATSASTIEPYLGGVIATTGTWASGHAPALRSFRTAYEKARDIAIDPSQRDDVITLVQRNQDIPRPLAEALVYAQLGDLGLARSSTFSSAAARNTLEVRARFDGFDRDQHLDALAAPDSELFYLAF